MRVDRLKMRREGIPNESPSLPKKTVRGQSNVDTRLGKKIEKKLSEADVLECGHLVNLDLCLALRGERYGVND